MIYHFDMTARTFARIVLGIIAYALIMFVMTRPAKAQNDSLIYQVNGIRSTPLTYNWSRQKQVNAYATSNKLLVQFNHSGMPCGEVIAVVLDPGDLMNSWMMSRPHRKILRDKRYKSMTSKIVKVVTPKETLYYGVIQLYQ